MAKLNPEQEALVGAYKRTFLTDDGQKVLAHLKARVNRPMIPRGDAPIDTNWLIYFEAQRALVLEIMRKIETTFDAPQPANPIMENEDGRD